MDNKKFTLEAHLEFSPNKDMLREISDTCQKIFRPYAHLKKKKKVSYS